MVSTHLKNIRQIGSFPQIGVKIKNIRNHHLDGRIRKNINQLNKSKSLESNGVTKGPKATPLWHFDISLYGWNLDALRHLYFNNYSPQITWLRFHSLYVKQPSRVFQKKLLICLPNNQGAPVDSQESTLELLTIRCRGDCKARSWGEGQGVRFQAMHEPFDGRNLRIGYPPIKIK